MLPKQGDLVHFTDAFLNDRTSPTWICAYKGVDLDVMSVKLQTMVPMAIYVVYVIVNGRMNSIRIDRMGRYVDDYGDNQHSIVFEDAIGGNIVASAPAPVNPAPRAVPTPAWVPDAPPQPKKEPNEDDRCRACGAMGKVAGMCCTCPNCGNVIWGA